MIKHYFLIFSFFCCQLVVLQAQEMSLYFMDGILQSTAVNPSFLPKKKVIYSFPGLSLGMTNSISSYNGMKMKNAEGVTVLNTDALLSDLSDHNYFRQNLAITTFQSMYGKKNWRISVSHSLKGNTYVAYPRGLVELAAKGNAEFIGETLEIAPEVDFSLYSETAFGYMMKIGRLSVGGRIKLLSGIANFSTDRSSATLTTDSEYYQLNVATDYRINAGGLVDVKGLIEDEAFDVSVRDDEFTFNSMFKKMNLGLDLGASMLLLDDKLMVSASIIDLGKIKWKNNPHNFHSSGTYRFEGVDINEVIDGEEVTGASSLDSLTTALDFVETNNTYSTTLPTKMYLSAKFKAHRFLSTGALVYFEPYRGHTYSGVAVDLTTHLGRILDFGLTASQVYKSSNLGAHMALKLGPVQIIAVTNNILAIVNPFEHKHVNARFGLNLAFGRKKILD